MSGFFRLQLSFILESIFLYLDGFTPRPGTNTIFVLDSDL